MSRQAALLGFAAVAGVVTLIPGVDTALVLRASLVQGRRYGFAAALGVASGVLVWGVAAAVGVSALLTASTAAYSALRILGAAYMIWLGVRYLRMALSRQSSKETIVAEGDVSTSAWECWRRGLLTNVLNPKIGAFYVAVLPQFIPAHSSHLLFGLLLALVHDLEGMAWFTLLILGAHSAREALSGRSTRRALDGATGGVLIGFGLKLGLGGR